MCEAFTRLPLDAFITNLPAVEGDAVRDSAASLLEQFQADLGAGTMLRGFIEEKSEESPTFAFWVSFLDRVQLLLRFIGATREGDWALHLVSLEEMLPWFFA